jgi:hypothetical protein
MRGVDADLAPLTEQQMAPFSSEDVTAARARCFAAEGPLDPVHTKRDVEVRVVRAWLVCNDGLGVISFGPLGAGIQILPDGTFSVLSEHGGGGLTAGSGYDESGTWEPHNAAGSSVGDIWYIDFHCGNCSSSSSPIFERDPRRIRAHFEGSASWLVPLTRAGM